MGVQIPGTAVMAEPSQIPNNQNNVRIPIEDDDSEWEYEYHETETDVCMNPPQTLHLNAI